MKSTTYNKIAKMVDVCRGCKNHDSSCGVRHSVGTHIPVTKYTPEGLDCPCSICLVKMMCVKPGNCEALQDYYAVARFIKGSEEDNHLAMNTAIAYIDSRCKTVKEYPDSIRDLVKGICP